MSMTRRELLAISIGTCGYLSQRLTKAAAMEDNETSFTLYPIGRVEKKKKHTRLRIYDKYKKALKGLDGFSHVIVLYWFDRNDIPKKRSILQVHPRGNKDNPLTGVFACRAPVRPNLIAHTICKIESVKGSVVTVKTIDAFDKTPILDLKPFFPGPQNDVRVPDWC